MSRLPKPVLVVLGALLLSVLFSVGIVIYSRFGHSDAELIATSLDNVRMAAQRKSARLVMFEIADDYHDGFGQDRKTLSERVTYWCGGHLTKEVEARLSDVKIVVAPDGKTAVAEVTVTGNAPVQEIVRWAGGRDQARLRVDYVHADRWKIRGCQKIN